MIKVNINIAVYVCDNVYKYIKALCFYHFISVCLLKKFIISIMFIIDIGNIVKDKYVKIVKIKMIIKMTTMMMMIMMIISNANM